MFKDKKIIMVMPERLGDTLMCTPAIHYLKHYYPTVQIDIIALSELARETLLNNPDISNIFVLPSHKKLKMLSGNYDRGINIHDSPLAREYLRTLNIPVLHLPSPDDKLHQAEQALQFVQAMLPEKFPVLDRRYHIYPQPDDITHVEQIFHEHQVDFSKALLIGCHIGCHSIAKKSFRLFKKNTHPKVWPFDYIVALAEKLRKTDNNIRLVITGSKNEESLGKILCKKEPRTVNFINKTTVPQLNALMGYLNAFISPDTGVMHVACSSHVPLIALFGPTVLTRTGPYPTLSNLTLLQGNNMLDISIDSVYDAVMQKIYPTVIHHGINQYPLNALSPVNNTGNY